MKKIKIKKLTLNKERVSALSQGSMQDVKGGRATEEYTCTEIASLVYCLTNEGGTNCTPKTIVTCYVCDDRG